jgi:hypothetical protein
MEYRGKHYTIVQGIRPDCWKWTVHLHEKSVKSGIATTREAARIRINVGYRYREGETASYPPREVVASLCNAVLYEKSKAP